MRKFLSLVMALVMMMSLVTITAGAEDFADVNDIQYLEAVEVINAIGVVDGYTDGSFGPSNGLSRQAAAKIICNLILGPTTAAELHADTAPYPDVPVTNEFAGYIAYCKQQGIISGYADGTFKGGNPLTGYAFMKMLLGALGYDSSIEGYTGPNWAINVAKQAIGIGLNDSLVEEFNGVDYVTREEAALYAFNTLKADMVDYESVTNITVGNTNLTIAGSKADTIYYADTKDYRESYGWSGANYGEDEVLQFCEKYFPTLKLNDETDVEDVFGRPANTWYKKNDKIGTYTKTADVEYTTDVAYKTIYADLDLSKPYSYDLVIDGVDNVDVPVIKRDGQLSTLKASKKIADLALEYDEAGESGIVGNGSLIEVFEDEQRITVINTYLMQVSGDYDEKREQLTLITLTQNNYPYSFIGDVLSSDDFAGLENFKDEDYVLVTIADNEVQSIQLAEPTVASVTEYVHEESLTAGGEEYLYSAAITTAESAKALTLKADAKLYLDNSGYVLWADTKTTDKYVFIYEFANANNMTSKSALEANAYFTDGTNEVILVNKIDTVKVNGSDVDTSGPEGPGRLSKVDITGDDNGDVATGWYKWSEKDGKYSLTSIYNTGALPADPGEVIIDYSGKHTEIEVGGTVRGDGTTKTNFIILEEDGDVRVYTGIKSVPDVIGATADPGNVATVVDISKSAIGSDYAVNVFIDLNDGQTKGGNTSSDIIFLLKAEKHGNDVDDDEYYRYKALVNGEETKVKYDKEVDASGTQAGTLWMDVEYTGKNYITFATMVTGPVAANREDVSRVTGAADVVEFSNGTLELGTGGNNDYFLAESYKIYKIEKATGEYEVFSNAKQLDREGMFARNTIYGILNADAEYTALYIVEE